MIYRLFVSPRGFANEGTIYEFQGRSARDAAFAHLMDIGYADDPSADFHKITAKGARAKLAGDDATESYVRTQAAEAFGDHFPGHAA